MLILAKKELDKNFLKLSLNVEKLDTENMILKIDN